MYYSVLTPACCSVLQCNAMCFCALQCAAVEERNTHTGVVPDIFLIRRSKGNPALNMGKSKVHISISSRQHPILDLQFVTHILFFTHLVAAGLYPPHEISRQNFVFHLQFMTQVEFVVHIEFVTHIVAVDTYIRQQKRIHIIILCFFFVQKMQTHVRALIHTHTRTLVHMHKHTRAHAHAHACARTRVDTHTHAHMNAHTHPTTH